MENQKELQIPKTADEFNKKYAEFLEEGHYGMSIPHVPSIEFLDNVFRDLTRIPGFEYSQIKWKFNSVRFYSNLKSRELTSWIEKELQHIGDAEA